jgi:hypothetical protein
MLTCLPVALRPRPPGLSAVATAIARHAIRQGIVSEFQEGKVDGPCPYDEPMTFDACARQS